MSSLFAAPTEDEIVERQATREQKATARLRARIDNLLKLHFPKYNDETLLADYRPLLDKIDEHLNVYKGQASSLSFTEKVLLAKAWEESITAEIVAAGGNNINAERLDYIGNRLPWLAHEHTEPTFRAMVKTYEQTKI